MVIEIKRSDGLIFTVNASDIKEIGEHITGGTYICMYDGDSMLLDQDYKTVKGVFCALGYRFNSVDFTLMSAQKFKMLKKRVKRVKRQNII